MKERLRLSLTLLWYSSSSKGRRKNYIRETLLLLNSLLILSFGLRPSKTPYKYISRLYLLLALLASDLIMRGV